MKTFLCWSWLGVGLGLPSRARQPQPNPSCCCDSSTHTGETGHCGLELSTNLCKVSQCLETASTKVACRRASQFQVYLQCWKRWNFAKVRWQFTADTGLELLIRAVISVCRPRQSGHDMSRWREDSASSQHAPGSHTHRSPGPWHYVVPRVHHHHHHHPVQIYDGRPKYQNTLLPVIRAN